MDLASIAQVDVTSEDTEHPIESALLAESTSGWRAGESGAQTIRLVFDEPQNISALRLVFVEDRNERQQEFSVHWSASEEEDVRQVLRQQFNFSPQGSVEEREEYAVELPHAKVLELRITPDMAHGVSRASLEELRVA